MWDARRDALVASGSGHHLFLAWGFPCSLLFGVAEVMCSVALVTHSALVSCPLSWGNLGVHMTEWPACTWPWPPWERGSYACAPTCPRRPQAHTGLAGGLLSPSGCPDGTRPPSPRLGAGGLGWLGSGF